MGNRASISFRHGNSESVTLFSHWGGMDFVETARVYARDLAIEAKKEGSCMPLHRMEPETVMVDFIRYITGGIERITNNLYLGKDENDGDNSDNGHHIIDL